MTATPLDVPAQPSSIRPAVGFCGLGKMGLPMARRILSSGQALHVWNRTLDKARELRHASPSLCAVDESPARLAQHCDVMLLCLADAPSVAAVVFGDDGLASAARPGALLIDHSTLAPTLTRSLADRWHAQTGGRWLDAPVSGGTAGAAAGTLAVMAGGDEARLDAARPLLAAYAARITRMGESGAGQASKLANQVIVMTTIAALAEATRLARGTGIDAARLPAALQGGWADSVLLQSVQPRMLAPPAQATGSIRTMLKDFDAIEAFAAEHGIALPLASLVRRWLARAVEHGLAEADVSQIVQVAPD
ncbi:NAD(P)-dependent oxidoreductase [Chitinasiproducens palmae]|uniref:3-hydroxyisobutyrate dehydrogenase n=1 Tax=Chitinasiproducens palmae TaxID=1770053 RepID=A0A1H2PJD2_9BURK|nr:NAD(P)-dependent oxidoreductase [Chitinasiproducens palmae]SDV46486.1 3-hydroxyisobutyrate dehydrogenase [Chitinasiproducens palmae]